MPTTIETVALGDLVAHWQLGRGELVSLIGGGGKTTTLFALGQQLTGTTVLTTTTKMGSDRTNGLPLLIDPTDAALISAAEVGPTLVWSDAAGHRATGVMPGECDRWFTELAIDNVVVEADGSRRRPFKAPADHEPVIPSKSTTVIACIGVGALDQPIAERCHRPALVAMLANCSEHDTLTATRAAAVLLSPEGSRKGCPPTARFIIAVCGVDAATADVAAELIESVNNAEIVAIRATD